MSGSASASASGSASRSPTGRDADARSVIQSIKRVRQATETWEDRQGNEHVRHDDDCRLHQMTHLLPPGFDWSAMRDEPECGVAEMKWFCEDCLEVHEARATCGKFGCPRCAPVWCRNRAMNAVKYLLALRQEKFRETGRHQYFHHVVVSPDSEWCPDSKEPLERTWRVVKEIADEMEMEGYGAFHLWSGGDDVEDDRGEWQGRLFEERDWEDVKTELNPRPHFHLLVVGDFVKGQEFTKRVEDETGWLITRIADEETGRSIDGGEDDPDNAEALAAATTYALSHTVGYETANGNTKGFWRSFGFRESDVDVFESTEAQATEAVRQASARTLGIPATEFECRGEKEVDVAADHPSVADEQGGEFLADEFEQDEQEVAGRAKGSARDDRGTGGGGGLGGGSSGDFSEKMTPTGELRDERRGRSRGGAGGSGGLPVVSDSDEKPPSERRRERAEALREGGTVSRAVDCGGSLRKIWDAPQFYEDKSLPVEKRRGLFESYQRECERWDFGPEPPDAPPESLR